MTTSSQDSLRRGGTLEAYERVRCGCSSPAVRHQSLIPRYFLTKVLVLLLVVSAFNPVMAMIRTLPFQTLVKEADLIVIARVADKVPLPQDEQKVPQLKNVLVIEQVLKGTRRQNEPIAILTIDTRGQRMEDAVTFPNKGQRVVLFLSGSGDSLRIVNGI